MYFVWIRLESLITNKRSMCFCFTWRMKKLFQHWIYYHYIMVILMKNLSTVIILFIYFFASLRFSLLILRCWCRFILLVMHINTNNTFECVKNSILFNSCVSPYSFHWHRIFISIGYYRVWNDFLLCVYSFFLSYFMENNKIGYVCQIEYVLSIYFSVSCLTNWFSHSFRIFFVASCRL